MSKELKIEGKTIYLTYMQKIFDFKILHQDIKIYSSLTQTLMILANFLYSKRQLLPYGKLSEWLKS